MNQTAKIDSTLNQPIDDEVMEEMENNEATKLFDYKPESEHLTDAEILDETFLDDYDDLETTDILDENFSFNPSDY
ncbi:MAG: hypothetical protein ACJ0SL_08615 [Candidatus Rariloculaceae bacterium]